MRDGVRRKKQQQQTNSHQKGSSGNSDTQVVSDGGKRNTQTERREQSRGTREDGERVHTKSSVLDTKVGFYKARCEKQEQEGMRGTFERAIKKLFVMQTQIARQTGGAGTDWEQNSLRCFCTAKGGCHIAGGRREGGRQAGPRASLARFLAMKGPGCNAASHVDIS